MRTDTYTWRVSVEAAEATVSRVQALARKATRKGFTGEVTATYTVETERKLGETLTYAALTITGRAPHYEGYEFLAKVDFDPHAGTIFRAAPGATGIDYATVESQGSYCDHCETRRQRKNTYIVRATTTGRQYQVGSTCIKDFLGADVRPSVILAEDLDQAIAEDRGPTTYSTEQVLTVAAAVIAYEGEYRSASAGSATVDRVAAVLCPRTPTSREYAREVIPTITDATRQAAAADRAYIISDAFSGESSSYARNLKKIAAADTVSAKNLGFLVSLPRAVARARETDAQRQERARQRAEREAARAAEPNEWIGTPGDTLTKRVTVLYVRSVETKWGEREIVGMRTDTGHKIKAWAAPYGLGDVAAGDELTITGEIKEHDEWKGRRETVLKACKALPS